MVLWRMSQDGYGFLLAFWLWNGFTKDMRMWNRIKIRRLLIRIGIALVCVVLFGFGYFMLTSKEAVVEQVKVGTANDVVLGNVYVREKHKTSINSRLKGAIAMVHVQIGDHVKKGDILVEWRDEALIDKIAEEEALRDERMNVRKLKSSYEFDYERRLVEYEMAKKEYETGGKSDREIELMERDLKQRGERIEITDINDDNYLARLNHNIKLMNMRLQYSKLYAPSDGIISEIYKRAGEVVSLGEPVMDLIYVEKKVVAEISEQDIDRIHEGDPCLIKFLGLGRDTYGGKVAFKLPKANPMTNRFDVHIKTDVPDMELVPGLTGEVSIILGSRENSLLVRPDALQEQLAYVVNGGWVEPRTVQLGYRGITHIEVLDGLKEGEWVIVQEMGRFKPGDWVKTKKRK